MMTETLPVFVGLILGAVFFGGLWWTVQRGLAAKAPALWFAVSLPLRTAVVLAGFYFVSNGDWRRVVACGGGFFVARILVTLMTRPPVQGRRSSIFTGARR